MTRIICGLALASTLIFAAGASATTCEPYLSQQAEKIQEIEGEPIGERGLLPWKGKPTAANKLLAFGKGIKWWGTKIFVVESKAEALELHQFLIQADALGSTAVTGIYVVSKPGNAARLQKMYEQMNGAKEKQSKEASDFWAEILKGDQIFQATREGELAPLTEKQKTQFDPAEIQVLQARPDSPPHFYKEGWHDPAQRGVMVLAKETFQPTGKPGKKTRSAVNRAIREGKEMLGEGYRIIVGEPAYMEAVVRGSKDQVRTKDGAQQASTWITEATIKQYVEMQKDGHAFNAVLLDPAGNPIAGNFGMIKDGRVWIASGFYPEGNINVLKVMGYALRIRLHQAGYRVVDQGMVSNYTKELGAKYYHRVEFHELSAQSKGAEPLNQKEFKPEEFDYAWGE